jgi:hypothetical protein
MYGGKRPVPTLRPATVFQEQHHSSLDHKLHDPRRRYFTPPLIDGHHIESSDPFETDFTKRNGTGGESIYGGPFADEDLTHPLDSEGSVLLSYFRELHI